MSEQTHNWAQHPATGFTFCRVCGVVKRADERNKPCRGVPPLRVGDAR